MSACLSACVYEGGTHEWPCPVVSAAQASNFLRAFRTLREALTLGLLLNEEEEEDKADLSKLIQKWNTFVLQQLHMVHYAEVPVSMAWGQSVMRSVARQFCK